MLFIFPLFFFSSLTREAAPTSVAVAMATNIYRSSSPHSLLRHYHQTTSHLHTQSRVDVRLGRFKDTVATVEEPTWRSQLSRSGGKVFFLSIQTRRRSFPGSQLSTLLRLPSSLSDQPSLDLFSAAQFLHQTKNSHTITKTVLPNILF